MGGGEERRAEAEAGGGGRAESEAESEVGGRRAEGEVGGGGWGFPRRALSTQIGPPGSLGTPGGS